MTLQQFADIGAPAHVACALTTTGQPDGTGPMNIYVAANLIADMLYLDGIVDNARAWTWGGTGAPMLANGDMVLTITAWFTESPQ